MPADISNSSSEDEEDTQTTASTDLPKRIVTKQNAYKCPEDFVSFTHKPCSGTLSNSLKNKNTELWLIKAPASFNPERFSGVAVPLSGLQTVRVPAAAAPGAEAASGGGLRQGLYSVLAAKRSPTDLHLLTAAGPASARVLCGPAFSGVLNVCEIYGDSGDALLRPQAIPAAPAPVIPPGLKQRFLPFGSKTPTLTCVPESELDAGATGPSSATLLPRVVKHFPTEEEMTEEERRKERKERKRRKREMRIKLESEDPAEEAVEVKLEAEEEEERMESIEAGLLEERRRKKKRKKDKERARERDAAGALEEALGEVEADCEVKEEEEVVVVKCEPIDFSYEDHEGSAKRKKKKRKSRAEED